MAFSSQFCSVLISETAQGFLDAHAGAFASYCYDLKGVRWFSVQESAWSRQAFHRR